MHGNMSKSADKEKVNKRLLPTNVDKSDSRIDLKTYGDVLKNTPTPRSNGTGQQIRTPSSGSHPPSKPNSSNIQVTNNLNSVNRTKKSGSKDGEKFQKVEKKRGRRDENARSGAMKTSESIKTISRKASFYASRFVPETKANDLKNMLKGTFTESKCKIFE
ncbi:hypothetical protein HHI36_019083 [Cryptolaemus montrouzieri]|uniref:Uncharacterized protein n=1 Tax=Cryptolaemus montrouzieri TaxID=559131 RepID=A0ABD2P238_9CUCU